MGRATKWRRMSSGILNQSLYHPQRQHRQQCSQRLMKKIKSVKGNAATFHPHLIYFYKSVIESLQELMSRPGFIEECELWRQRNIPSGMYSDVYDGKVSKDFMYVNGQNFLASPFNYAFYLNVDWFQLFLHTQHSEGAIYLSVLNLPRQKRFLKENIILVGVIPGPKEPAIHINSFLKPLVNDLLKCGMVFSQQYYHTCSCSSHLCWM